MEGKLNKTDSKYLKTAIKLLRQGNTMLKILSEKSEIDAVSIATANIYNEIEESLKKINKINDYISTGKYVQLSINFEEE